MELWKKAPLLSTLCSNLTFGSVKLTVVLQDYLGGKNKRSEILPCVFSATLFLFLSNLPFFIPDEKLCWFIIWLK